MYTFPISNDQQFEGRPLEGETPEEIFSQKLEDERVFCFYKKDSFTKIGWAYMPEEIEEMIFLQEQGIIKDLMFLAIKQEWVAKFIATYLTMF